MLKEQKGITLVALIITIIVMLILAGVSLSLVLGEGGAINEARNVQFEQEKGKLRDAINLANTNLATDYYTDTDVKKVSYMSKYGVVDPDPTSATLGDETIDLTKLITSVESNFQSDYAIKFKKYEDAETSSELTNATAVSTGEFYIYLGNKTNVTPPAVPTYSTDIPDADGNLVWVKVKVEFTTNAEGIVTGPIQFKVVQ